MDAYWQLNRSDDGVILLYTRCVNLTNGNDLESIVWSHIIYGRMYKMSLDR